MFRITQEVHFSYGHRLTNYEGPCANLHGHNARVQIELSSDRLNHQGMVVDFFEVKKTLGEWIKNTLDHKLILADNDPLVPVLEKAGEPFVVMKESPTAEALARWIFTEGRHLRLPISRITLWETANSAAVYHE